MKVRPSALIWRVQDSQTEVLLMRYCYGGQDVFALPGGNPDRGEILPETIVRELHEELGVRVDVGEMILAGEMLLTERNDDVLHVVFAARNLQGTPELNPAETSALELVWKPITDISQLNLYPNVGARLLPWFSSATYLGYIGRIEQRYFG
ncbi:ADP-ribose pyrophosphatase YjhB (NUDIX family) [Spirosoma oryzae]|uniref:ADP-ribose pyrophosphatase YjhB (NUDIX family) n=1 Tax=Spirosoma oryzae TaxID=1469603 RepID=A0A2T0SHC3_9BACT|nr:NUDIX hydrolase [Spirosoma oryzae]PRY32812.1 ADP-ribose pyrophosphatase YjhB (NUDIX family) [Spirosoma oryzae]